MTEKLNSFQEGKLNAESLASSVSLKSGFKEGIKKANIAGELGKRIQNWPAIVAAKGAKQAA